MAAFRTSQIETFSPTAEERSNYRPYLLEELAEVRPACVVSSNLGFVEMNRRSGRVVGRTLSILRAEHSGG